MGAPFYVALERRAGRTTVWRPTLQPSEDRLEWGTLCDEVGYRNFGTALALVVITNTAAGAEAPHTCGGQIAGLKSGASTIETPRKPMPTLLRLRILPLLLCLLGALGGTALALDRHAFTFVRYDLQARLDPAEQTLAVGGTVTLRNDSPEPQRVLALQISSSLNWQSITLGGKPTMYLSQPYVTDIDHTGSVREAIVTLSAPVPAGGTVELAVAYAGAITADTTRLTRIGVPAQTAAASDWDQIGDSFTALRGVGYVCWYPVAMDSASLSDGAQLSHILGEWKERHAGTPMHLTLTVASDKPVVANGRLLRQKVTTGEKGPVQERVYDFAPMGPIPPTFAIASYTVLSRPAINVFYLPGRQAASQEYALAAEKLQPFLNDWLGAEREKAAVVELPEGDAPFDSGALLFTPLTSDRQTIEVAIAHPMAHARFASRRLWMEEGLAHFIQALVRERQSGRKAALGSLQQFRLAVAEAEKRAGQETTETSSSSISSGSLGEPLTRADDEIYYRWKAMFVWWMLRDMIGDQALQNVLQQYRPADDKEPSYLQRLVEARTKRSFEWFFDDWVYRDRGLPDFHIDAVRSRHALPDSPGTDAMVQVSVIVRNDGGAGAEVPVTAPLPGGGEARQRVRVPAHGRAVAHIETPVTPDKVVVNDGSVPVAKPGAVGIEAGVEKPKAEELPSHP